MAFSMLDAVVRILGIMVAVLGVFAVYCVIVIRYRARREREREKREGLDPLR